MSRSVISPQCQFIYPDGTQCKTTSHIGCDYGYCGPHTDYCMPHYLLAHDRNEVNNPMVKPFLARKEQERELREKAAAAARKEVTQ